MNKYLNFFKKKERIIYLIFTLNILLFLIALFLQDFNLLKIFIFLGILFLGFNLFLFSSLEKSEKKEKEKETFSFFQNLLDFLLEGIVLYDNDFKILFVNSSFEKLVNLKKENLIGLKVEQSLIKNEKYEMLANIFFPFIKGEDLKIINQNPETIFVKFEKERYFLISYIPIFLEKQYKLRIVLDKTEDIIEGQRRLEFTQLVSHHLLTPLNEIKWILEAVDKKNLNEENKDFLESALQIIKNSVFFAESILTLIRTEGKRLELNIQELDLEKILVSILDILKIKIEEKKIKVEAEITKKANPFGDENLIRSALYSLIENAVLYNKIGGLVQITVEKFPTRPYLEIKIKDSGIGMSQEDLENLFKKYYRGRKAKDVKSQGFGFGLYLTKIIIDLHGGEIKIESEEDKGTTVSILLPTDPNLIPKQK